MHSFFLGFSKQNNKLLRHRLIFFIVFSLFLCTSCSSPEQDYVKEVVGLTTFVETEGANLTQAQWEVVIDEYTSLRSQCDTTYYNFTAEDKFVIDSCYRDLNAAIAKGVINQGINKASGYLNEIINLFEDLVEN